ncbi:GTP cyclohydrolase II RibA [Marinobacter nanhaiticus D15-8W]|uniref:GTP cyclohydrolase-2 n=1 Tax=Marinobacter nanhaiticus D15-8W TaxID=626887 RepID=N6WTH6_9GAMM|nr:GTP cyclohydrolase II RibA [Marinobacter nanhaiticus D15-8W]
MRKVERAIVELKAGEPVLVTDGDEAALVFSIEGVDSPAFEAWIDRLNASSVAVTLTRKRLESLGIDHSSTSGGVLEIPLTDTMGMAPLIDSLQRLGTQTTTNSGVSSSDLAEPEAIQQASLTLMRQGRLLPASVSIGVPTDARPEIDGALHSQDLMRVDAADVSDFEQTVERHLHRVSEAQVPLEGAEETRFVLFREGSGLREHLALLIGDPSHWPDPVPVRMHSACLTGDLFGSLRCDCGEQLRGAVRSISEEGGGVLLYLAQEGRDIGLANKLRAYSLQDQGLDTVDADQVLGFADDERRYGVAVGMLRSLGIERIDLLTNNPGKIQAILDGGIEVGKRRELLGRVTPYNRRYLAAKAERSGHLLGASLKTG